MSNQVEKATKFETTTGEVTLTPTTVKNYLVNGQGNVTDQEVMMFIGLCKANKLNPFNRDAYLIKYGSQPASTILSKDVFFRRAIGNPNYNGMKSGIIVLDKDNQIVKRDGAIYVKSLGEQVIGAWCEVFRKDWTNSVYQEVNFDEYSGKKSDGNLNANWSGKPAVMITKVAEATALRKAFTDELQQLYIDEEIRDDEPIKFSDVSSNENLEATKEAFADILDVDSEVIEND